VQLPNQVGQRHFYSPSVGVIFSLCRNHLPGTKRESVAASSPRKLHRKSDFFSRAPIKTEREEREEREAKEKCFKTEAAWANLICAMANNNKTCFRVARTLHNLKHNSERRSRENRESTEGSMASAATQIMRRARAVVEEIESSK
jgi:hypothetical protein